MSVGFKKLIDKYFVGAACVALAPFSLRRRLSFHEIRRILVVKLWAVGESVLTLPMIKVLKEKFPKSQIDVMAMGKNREVFEACKYVDNVIGFGLVFRKYDVVIDCEPWMNTSALVGFFAGRNRIGFSHGVRSLLYNKRVEFDDKQHEVLTFLDLSKNVSAHYSPSELVKLSVKKEDMDKVNSFWKQKKLSGFVVGIAPSVGDSSKSRMWSLERYAKVAEHIISKKGKVLLVGTCSDLDVLNELNDLIDKKTRKEVVMAAGKLSLKQSFGLIGKCKCFISNDTGPMHIAAAMGVPTIGLFGPNTPVRFAPFGPRNISIYHAKACSPCINVHRSQIGECKEGIECLSDIAVEEVVEAVEKIRRGKA